MAWLRRLENLFRNLLRREQVERELDREVQAYFGILVDFSAVSLFTAAIGLYGVLSYSTGQRRGEIGAKSGLKSGLDRMPGTGIESHPQSVHQSLGRKKNCADFGSFNP